MMMLVWFEWCVLGLSAHKWCSDCRNGGTHANYNNLMKIMEWKRCIKFIATSLIGLRWWQSAIMTLWFVWCASGLHCSRMELLAMQEHLYRSLVKVKAIKQRIIFVLFLPFSWHLVTRVYLFTFSLKYIKCTHQLGHGDLLFAYSHDILDTHT